MVLTTLYSTSLHSFCRLYGDSSAPRIGLFPVHSAIERTNFAGKTSGANGAVWPQAGHLLYVLTLCTRVVQRQPCTKTGRLTPSPPPRPIYKKRLDKSHRAITYHHALHLAFWALSSFPLPPSLLFSSSATLLLTSSSSTFALPSATPTHLNNSSASTSLPPNLAI